MFARIQIMNGDNPDSVIYCWNSLYYIHIKATRLFIWHLTEGWTLEPVVRQKGRINVTQIIGGLLRFHLGSEKKGLLSWFCSDVPITLDSVRAFAVVRRCLIHCWPLTDLGIMPLWKRRFYFAVWLRFAVGFAELHRGSVTRTVMGHWVKMGCCLPGPSNPGTTGNQPA